MKTVTTKIDKRQDGDYSITIKLLRWNINELRALTAALRLHPMGRWIAEPLQTALIKSQAKIEAEAASQEVT